MFELRNGFENIPEVRKLFSEYTGMLVSLNPDFGKCFVHQNYEKEVEYLDEHYGFTPAECYNNSPVEDTLFSLFFLINLREFSLPSGGRVVISATLVTRFRTAFPG